MAQIVARLAPSEGYTESVMEGVRFMRLNRSLARTPVLYEPSICIIVQGRKRGFLQGEMFVYDAQHYLVVSVPMLFESEADASVEQPLLGLSLRINQVLATELALLLDEAGGLPPATPRSLFSTPLTGSLADAVLRLLEVLCLPLEARVLGAAILREIFFRALTGEQGAAMRAALMQGSHFHKIGKALRRIHADYVAGIDVQTLAGEAGMSVPAFHAHFKAVTATSPIQYLKAMRLHQARLLMVRSGVTAASASLAVGYESASQFSREFKRMFGRTPAEETLQMKSALLLMPAERP